MQLNPLSLVLSNRLCNGFAVSGVVTFPQAPVGPKPPSGGAAAVGFGCFKHERQVRRGVGLGLPPPFTPRPTCTHRHVGVLGVGWVTRPDIHPRGPMSPDTQFAFTITPRMDYK